jgi:nucleotide-binding universal stress UspA family protein
VILICYDGSVDSRAAIERAGELLAGQSATVLTIWEPFVEVMTRSSYGLGLTAGMVNIDDIDAANRKGAEASAEEGAELARKVGLNAQPRTCSQVSTVADAILAEADAIGAGAIVMGSRGLTGVKSLLLGSVSHNVIQHADRTVIVVPSPDVAVAREHERRRSHAPAQHPLKQP